MTTEPIVDFVPTSGATASSSSSSGAATRKVNGLVIPQSVKDFFLAKNPVHSALGFLLFNLCYYLVAYSNYSALSLFLYLLVVNLAVTILVLAAMTVLHKFNAGPQPPSTIQPLQLDTETIVQIVEGLIAEINCCLRSYGKWRALTNVPQSLLAVGGLFVAAKIAQCFSLMCISYTAGLAAFILPPLYMSNRAVIDQQLAVAKSKAVDVYAQLYARLPAQIRQAAEGKRD